MRKRSKILELANIPEKISISDINYDECYQKIQKYYDTPDSLITPYQYRIRSDGETEEVKSLLGGVSGEDAPIEEIISVDKRYSNYSTEHLNRLNFPVDETWNGSISSIQYSYNGTLQYAESDYYTQTFFSNLLTIESANNPIGRMDLRSQFASDIEEFSDRPWFTTGGSIGGLIVHKSSDGYKALIGRRSSDEIYNPDRYSIIPNALLDPTKMDRGLDDTIRRMLNKEVLGHLKESSNDIDQDIELSNILNGWNLRDTQFQIYYLIEVIDTDTYEKIKENAQSADNEFAEIIEIDLFDLKDLREYVNFSSMSPEVIPLIIESVRKLSESIDAMDYSIERTQP